MSESSGEWQLLQKKKLTDRFDWIEEEEKLIHWSEHLNFEKQPLQDIAVTFIYVNRVLEIVGMLKTVVVLTTEKTISHLDKTVLYEKIEMAKTPNTLFSSQPWLYKKYNADDIAIYNVIHAEEDIDKINIDIPFMPLHFPNKIPNSVTVLHDIHEVVVIMREVNLSPSLGLKSIIRDSSKVGNKTKKVRISTSEPDKYYYQIKQPIVGKRKTRRHP